MRLPQFCLGALVSVVCVLPGRAAAGSPKPNIIFVLCDDLGYGDVGVFFQNQRAEKKDLAQPFHLTPNLDVFAKEGLQLRHYYCPAPVCAPSRASLLLGVHQGHSNVRDNQFDKALENNHTVASVLQEAGYATAAIGKWGLQGKKEGADWPAHPLNRGFGYYYGYITHKAGHFHYPKEDKQELFEDRTDVSEALDGCYTADLFTARAKKWISDQKTTQPEKPFFLYLAYDTPHAKLQLPAAPYPPGRGLTGGLQWLGKAGHMINTADGQPDSYVHPEYARATWDHDQDPATPAVAWPDVYQRFATDVRRIDDCLGDIVQQLKDLKIDDQTLIVFTSDNGPSVESYMKEPYKADFFHSFGPFDGIKRDCWEGGIRVGAITRWPAGIPANRVSQQACSAADWLPTFAELAGIPAPARTDGVSLVPTLSAVGKQKSPTVYVEYQVGGKTPAYEAFAASRRDRVRGQMQFLREGQFAGVRYNVHAHSDDFEIYDVVSDPKQEHNLAATQVELQQRLKDRVLQVRRPDGEAKRPYDGELLPAVVVGQVQAGARWNTYGGRFAWVPELSGLTPEASGVAMRADTSVGKGGGAVLVSGYVKVPVDGVYVFHLGGKSRAFLRIHEAQVVDADLGAGRGGKKREVAREGSVGLKAGLHPFELTALQGTDGPVTLEWSGPGVSQEVISGDALWREGAEGR